MKAERSATLRDRFPDLQFAMITDVVIDADFPARAAALDVAAPIERDADRIERAVAAADSFFRVEGHRCPLPGQLAGARRKGLPPVPPLVRALLYAEMSTGVLLGVQDAAGMRGDLLLDLAQDGETFAGMRGDVVCRAGEPVIRDGAGIIASVFQGPDHRTRIDDGTTQPIFYAFGVPGLDRERLDAAITAVRELFPAGSAVVHG
ncbi:hypothetical protein ACLQ29_14290 [Micromonospora sp. DT228]|uniref:hypothetical protein n=1 Tax=Micromonospora sp. DT228 TaxID=3393443 RepID=UPI003CF47DCE